MNSMIPGGLILFLLISPTTTEALRKCSEFQDGFRNALERAVGKICDEIETDDLEELEELDLNGMSLGDFHSFEGELFEEGLRDLKFLDLSNNKVHYLPEEIWTMRDLEELDISGNPISFVPWYLAEELRSLDRIDYSKTNISTSLDHGDRMMAVIHQGMSVNIGTGAGSLESCSTACYDHYAYIQSSDDIYYFYGCADDDYGNECSSIAQRWVEELKAGNRLLISLHWPSTEIIRRLSFAMEEKVASHSFTRIIQSVTVLTGSPQRFVLTEERPQHFLPSQHDNSIVFYPFCIRVDGFPHSSYKECHYNFGIEKCSANSHGEVIRCVRKPENGEPVEWLSSEICPIDNVCPRNWNREWYQSGGSPKSPVTVIDGYYSG